ncbi:hypothetical protein [Thalassotalea sp. PLHSN55]|uniref:hypothetical protein n=1 Tax=Thalassotalea sp. PLHSN55 TaxID=3435888 RepID=UPI003F86D7AC
MEEVNIIKLSNLSYEITIIQQRKKQPTIICSPPKNKSYLCLTTHAEAIIENTIYEHWCPISQEFYKKPNQIFFRILKFFYLKKRGTWGHVINKTRWLEHIPKGLGLAIYNRLLRRVYLSKEGDLIWSGNINSKEISEYYQISKKVIDNLL